MTIHWNETEWTFEWLHWLTYSSTRLCIHHMNAFLWQSFKSGIVQKNACYFAIISKWTHYTSYPIIIPLQYIENAFVRLFCVFILSTVCLCSGLFRYFILKRHRIVRGLLLKRRIEWDWRERGYVSGRVIWKKLNNTNGNPLIVLLVGHCIQTAT